MFNHSNDQMYPVRHYLHIAVTGTCSRWHDISMIDFVHSSKRSLSSCSVILPPKPLPSLNKDAQSNLETMHVRPPELATTKTPPILHNSPNHCTPATLTLHELIKALLKHPPPQINVLPNPLELEYPQKYHPCTSATTSAIIHPPSFQSHL